MGAVNHSTNHPDYTKWSDELEYKVMEHPYRQGWDFTFRKKYYSPIPSSLIFYHGDDWIYSQLYSLGKKGAYVLSSPILHYEASTDESRGAKKLTNDYQIWHSSDIKAKYKNLRFSNEYCKLKPQFQKLTYQKSSKKAFVFHANEQYFNIIYTAILSIRQYSNLPIYVYLINSNQKIDISGVTTIKWKINLENKDDNYVQEGDNFYINRSSSEIYNILIQKPLVVKHALENFADIVAYIDSDSIATPYVENIFNYYNNNKSYPYFGEGIYDYLHYNGRGGAMDPNNLSTTLEHPVSELFKLNQYNRVGKRYRQTGYFIAGKNNIEFLEEWYWMLTHPSILKNTSYYAPYHEETILNPLLWDREFYNGLPLVYINGTLETISEVYQKLGFTGIGREIKPWLKIPANKNNLLFFHGEKRIDVRNKMIVKLKQLYETGTI